MASLLKQLAQQTLTLGGTPQRLTSTATLAESILIRAESTNAGTVYVGDSTVASTSGIPLAAGESVRLELPRVPGGGNDYTDLRNIYWDGTTSDRIRVSYWQRQN